MAPTMMPASGAALTMPFSSRRQAEILDDQRQGDAGHEDDQPLEELAGGGEQPDPPLHAGHRNEVCRGAVGPGRRLVDVALDGARRLGHVMGPIEERNHSEETSC